MLDSTMATLRGLLFGSWVCGWSGRFFELLFRCKMYWYVYIYIYIYIDIYNVYIYIHTVLAILFVGPSL